jgi:hypothetical protein
VKGRGVGKNGRSKGGPPFVQLRHYLVDSEAWNTLTPAERSVYVAMRRLYNGSNNGQIGLGARRAAILAGISKNTACKCFAALIEKGFVECVTPGGFNTNDRRQTEWRLTDERCDVTGAAPSKAFMRWRSDDPSQCKTTYQTRDTQVPIRGQFGPKTPGSVPRLGPKAAGRAA